LNQLQQLSDAQSAQSVGGFGMLAPNGQQPGNYPNGLAPAYVGQPMATNNGNATIGEGNAVNEFNTLNNTLMPPTQRQESRFTPPTGSPITSTQLQTKDVNGWVQQEFLQPTWTGLSVRSSQNRSQAPASTASQQTSYPTR
jgi:hypothetical protein